RPTTPQWLAGCLIEPPVSEPRAASAKSPATAAAEPPEDPPGTRDVSCGFLLGPYAEFSVELPMANSSMFARPIKTAPAFLSFSTAVAVYGAMYPSSIFDAEPTRLPSLRRLSLRAIG